VYVSSNIDLKANFSPFQKK